jgi:hypothetical protein
MKTFLALLLASGMALGQAPTTGLTTGPLTAVSGNVAIFSVNGSVFDGGFKANCAQTTGCIFLITSSGATQQPLVSTTISGVTKPALSQDSAGNTQIGSGASGQVWVRGLGGSILGSSNSGDAVTLDGLTGSVYAGNDNISGLSTDASWSQVGIASNTVNHLLNFVSKVPGTPPVLTVRGYFEAWGASNPFGFHAPGLIFPVTFTVSALPACTSSNKGGMAEVSDAAASPAYLGTATGGGTLTMPVMCTGSAWQYH